jgi:hypothetical protein
MAGRKKQADKAREKARKARRQARLAIGSVPPQRVIEPKKTRQPKHRKQADPDREP